MKKQILLMFGFVILFTSCSSKPQDRIVGNWQDKDHPSETIEFFPDGPMNCRSSFTDRATGTTYSGIGTYKILDETHLKFEWPDGVTHRGPITEIRRIILTKDDLSTFDGSSGVQMTQYRKVN